jgi:type IV secretion/conjugal transfer VirB4 family ATPase
MISLKTLRNRKAGLPDLLNFAAVVDDGIVLNKDGSLMAGWFYEGADISSSTDEERNGRSERLNRAFAKLGTGWMTHVDAIRYPARNYPAPAESHFGDPVSRLIDNERRGQFEAEGSHFQSMYALVATFLPPLASTQKVQSLMYQKERGANLENAGDRTLASFKQQLAELEDALSGVVRLQRMKGRPYVDEAGTEHLNEELLQYLNFAISGDEHPINLPPCPMYLDAVLGGRDFFTGVTPKLGSNFIGVLSIDGFPNESTPGILAALDRLPVRYRWSTRFIFMDTEEAKSHLEAYRRKWTQKQRGFLDQILKTNRSGVDQDAVNMTLETEAARADASSGLMTFGYFTGTVVFLSEKRAELDEAARIARRAIQNLGFGCRIETVNTVEAWLGSLPGHGVQNVRRPLLSTRVLADLIPSASVWPGHETCQCPFYPENSPPLLYAATEGATPFRLNLHVGDLGHTLIFGPTGAGKSTLLGLIVAQFRRYRGATVFAFDKGNSLLALTKACGGKHFELASEHAKGGGFTPLANIDTDNDQGWAEEWIETCAAIQMGASKINPSHRNAIHLAMKLLRSAPRENRTVTDYVTNLQNLELREALQYYTVAGAAGDLLDSNEENLVFSDFQTFEMEDLLARGDKVAIPVLLYLFRRIEKSLRGAPTLLPIDEAWLMLEHPVFKPKIREWLKVMRKNNCAIILATQSLADAAKSGIFDVLLESCPTKILLPNEEATKGDTSTEGPRRFYEQIGLNPRQIELLAAATKKRHYYYLSTEGRRLFDLNLGPVALAFVGASSKEDLAAVRDLERIHGIAWPLRWLEKRGVRPTPAQRAALETDQSAAA